MYIISYYLFFNNLDSECLQSQSEFQPKRNEARAKLSALSHTRYRVIKIYRKSIYKYI